MTHPDDYLTVTTGKPPHPPHPYTPNARELFWISVGCVAASGIAIGMALQNMLTGFVRALGG